MTTKPTNSGAFHERGGLTNDQVVMLEGSPSQPYGASPVFDAETLPAALRHAHSTKAGTWGLIRVFEGQVRYCIEETGETSLLDAEHPGLIRPQELHHVEAVGPMRMQVEFYREEPALAA